VKNYQPATHRRTKVDWYPKPWIDIVQVKVSEDQERETENDIYNSNHIEQIGARQINKCNVI